MSTWNQTSYIQILCLTGRLFASGSIWLLQKIMDGVVWALPRNQVQSQRKVSSEVSNPRQEQPKVNGTLV